MRALRLVVWAAVVVGGAWGQPFPPAEDPPSIVESGYCAPMFLMPEFQQEKYAGKWFTVARVPNPYVPLGSCMVDTVSLMDDGETLYVVTKGFDEDNNPSIIDAELEVVVPFNIFEENFLQLKSPGVPTVPYHIIDTDYTSYSCIYSCFELMGIRAEVFYVLSRTPTLDTTSHQHCLDLFIEEDVNTTKLIPMKQSGCPDMDQVEMTPLRNTKLVDYGSKDGKPGESTLDEVEDLASSLEKTVINEVKEVRQEGEKLASELIKDLTQAVEGTQDLKDSHVVERETPNDYTHSGSSCHTLPLLSLLAPLIALWGGR